MRRNRNLFQLLILVPLALLGISYEVFPDPATSVWPMPSSMTAGSNVVYMPYDGFFFQTVDRKSGGEVQSYTLQQAYERYNNLIFAEHYSNETLVGPALSAKVTVIVDDTSEAYPQLETDESYEIYIPSSSNGAIQLTSGSIYGALRALETLSQIIFYDFETGHYKITSAPISITDTPRFLHRGILLDTARHFEPVSAIERLIDAMSYSKFNVLHWHVVDTQSFPFQSRTYPKLWDGAFSASERYRQEEAAQIVEYGRLRGIKVMIEFDVPGHAAAWCTGYPEICPMPKCLEPLDPSTNATFDLIDSLLSESTGRSPGSGLFPYRLLHLGGDEVSYRCWELDDDIQTWKTQQGMSNSEDIYEYFVDRVASITRDQSRTPVQWVEVFEHFGNSLDKNTVIHVWKEKSTMTSVISAGYNALLSDNDLWYLDNLAVTWDKMYDNEPTELLNPNSDISLLLGGEVCMWGETVDTSDLDNTVWPRAAAVAER